MNIEKSRLKVNFITDVGVRMDDSREAAIRETAQWEGAVSALQQTARDIEALMAHVDADLAKEAYSLEEGSRTKRYIARAKQVAENHMVQATNNRLVAQGKVMAYEALVKHLQKMREEEELRITNILKAIEAEDIQAEDVGRPVQGSLKAQRLAEEKAEQESAAQAAQKSIEPIDAIGGVPSSGEPPITKTPTKGRKARAINT